MSHHLPSRSSRDVQRIFERLVVVVVVKVVRPFVLAIIIRVPFVDHDDGIYQSVVSLLLLPIGPLLLTKMDERGETQRATSFAAVRCKNPR